MLEPEAFRPRGFESSERNRRQLDLPGALTGNIAPRAHRLLRCEGSHCPCPKIERPKSKGAQYLPNTYAAGIGSRVQIFLELSPCPALASSPQLTYRT